MKKKLWDHVKYKSHFCVLENTHNILNFSKLNYEKKFNITEKQIASAHFTDDKWLL